MVPLILRFVDFVSYENYLRLQDTFATKGVGVDAHPGFDAIQDRIVIKRPVHGEVHLLFNPTDAPLVDVEFTEDFLRTEIPNIANTAIGELQKNIDKQNLYSEQDIEGYFKKNCLKGSNYLSEQYEQATYLPEEIKNLLLVELKKLVAYCDARIKDPYPEIKQKIQVRCNRVDIEAFFVLLRKHRKIEYISDADLGRIIENVFEYESASGSRVYTKISSSASKITDIHNFNRNIDKAIKRLKKTFSTDFFSHEVG